jgi:Zn-dependent protease
MLGRSITLFKLLGFDIKVDFSWVFLAVLISWSLATGFFPQVHEGAEPVTYWIMGLAGAFGLFFSIIFHELAHSIVARRFGMRIRGITLFIFGGVAEMEDEPPSAVAEFLMAIAGPIASLFLAWAFGHVSAFGELQGFGLPALTVVGYLSLINLILAIFNMLPAFPLDGGRALRAALWFFRKDMHSATITAARLGGWFGIAMMGMALVFVFTGDIIAGLWWGLIGLFLRGAAMGAVRQQEASRTIGGVPVWRFMVRDPVTVPPNLTIQEFVDDYLYSLFHDVYPVVDGEKVLGLIVSKSVKSVPQEEWRDTKIQSLMDPVSTDNSVSPDLDAVRALSLMNRTCNSRLLVIEKGRLVGLIAMKDLMRLLQIKMDL